MEKQPPIAYLHLPFQFEEEKLIAELSVIMEKKWLPHFNPTDYQGSWTTLSLYAPNGDETNPFATQNASQPIKETPILAQCPYLKAVIQHFHCPLLSVRLLRLGAGAYIKPHRDNCLGYEDGEFRLHIPIQTNSEVAFVLNGERIDMLPGECWYTNVNYEHSVFNGGATDRIHLVIDAKRNAWSDQLFFSLAPPERFSPTPPSHSPEEVQQIIQELKRQNLPVPQQFLEDLPAEIETNANKQT